MKRLRIGVLLCAVVACASLLLAGCQSQEYKPEAKDPTVSSANLVTPGTLTVGVNSASVPLAGQTGSGIVGIDADVAAYLADQMGLKVALVDVGNDPATALNDKKVDIVLGVEATDIDDGYWKSAAYLQTGVALFGTASESAVPTVDSKPQIAAQSSSKSSWRVTNLFGDGSLIEQEDLKSVFDALNKGSARYAAADAVIGTYVADTGNYDDKIIALLQEPSGYCAAVAESNTEMQGAVTSAIDKMVNGGMMNVIQTKWLGTTLSLDDVTVVKAATAPKDKSKEAPPADDNPGEGEPGEGEPAADEGAGDGGGEGEGEGGAAE